MQGNQNEENIFQKGDVNSYSFIADCFFASSILSQCFSAFGIIGTGDRFAHYGLAMTRLIALLSIAVFASTLFGLLAVQGQRPESFALPNQEIRPIASLSAQQLVRTQRIREGTTFKGMLVFFRQIGDRTAMYTVEDNRRFLCLENLALERILTTIEEKPERQIWKIDGEFTEFRGENYVLIRRALFSQNPTMMQPLQER